MAVRVDHRLQRLRRTMPEVQFDARFRHFHREQRVHDHDPLGPLDDRHVREVQVAHLVDPLDDLKQSAYVDQLRLPPEARVHGVGGLDVLLDEAVFGQIPDQTPI